mmetsp:Transcript_17445/g.52423  ORF Transcript_17445/g.52423 Transcript_17445/m.52423 type:complete len:200 (-) Transcript_17445:859-1458(-)
MQAGCGCCGTARFTAACSAWRWCSQTEASLTCCARCARTTQASTSSSCLSAARARSASSPLSPCSARRRPRACSRSSWQCRRSRQSRRCFWQRDDSSRRFCQPPSSSTMCACRACSRNSPASPTRCPRARPSTCCWRRTEATPGTTPRSSNASSSPPCRPAAWLMAPSQRAPRRQLRCGGSARALPRRWARRARCTSTM